MRTIRRNRRRRRRRGNPTSGFIDTSEPSGPTCGGRFDSALSGDETVPIRLKPRAPRRWVHGGRCLSVLVSNLRFGGDPSRAVFPNPREGGRWEDRYALTAIPTARLTQEEFRGFAPLVHERFTRWTIATRTLGRLHRQVKVKSWIGRIANHLATVAKPDIAIGIGAVGLVGAKRSPSDLCTRTWISRFLSEPQSTSTPTNGRTSQAIRSQAASCATTASSVAKCERVPATGDGYASATLV